MNGDATDDGVSRDGQSQVDLTTATEQQIYDVMKSCM